MIARKVIAHQLDEKLEAADASLKSAYADHRQAIVAASRAAEERALKLADFHIYGLMHALAGAAAAAGIENDNGGRSGHGAAGKLLREFGDIDWPRGINHHGLKRARQGTIRAMYPAVDEAADALRGKLEIAR